MNDIKLKTFDFIFAKLILLTFSKKTTLTLVLCKPFTTDKDAMLKHRSYILWTFNE